MSSETYFSSQIRKPIEILASHLISYCKTFKQRISRKSAVVMIRVLLMQTEWKHFCPERVSKNEREGLLKACYNFFYNENFISSATLIMQCYFYERFLNREHFSELQKQIILKKCSYLLKKLQKVWHNATEDLKEMYDDLVKLILIKEGMDDLDDSNSFDEMKAALSSAFPQSSMSRFVLSDQKTKMAFINEISSIASGIRLHAWYSKKAGKFMFDVGKIMKETLPRVCEELHEEFNSINESVESLQEILIHSEDISGDKKDDLHKKLLLIRSINYCQFIKMLKECIDDVAAETYKLDYTFAIYVHELDSALKISRYDQVNPIYKRISKTWKQIQIEGHLLNLYTNMYHGLKQLYMASNETNTHNVDFTGTLRENTGGESDTITKIYPQDVKNFEEITLRYNDFCAFHCSKGILVPCKRKLGIVLYKNSCYAFFDKTAMENFCSTPRQLIDSINTYMENIFELIVTLQEEEHFNLPILNKKAEETKPIFIKNISIQTVTHPIDKNIDVTYNWNQWSMRKEALKYVDLQGKLTHSTQTNLSNFRRENYTQVYPPKDNCTQMSKDASTATSKAENPELYINRNK